MPTIKVRIINREITSRRRAGLRIESGAPQILDVDDEQFEKLANDNFLEVEIYEDESLENDDNHQTDDKTDENGGELEENLNTDLETDLKTQEEAGNASDSETGKNEGENEKKLEESDNKDEYPSELAAIKRQSRDTVVSQAKSLNIELDFDDQIKTTKAIMAEAIVTKLSEEKKD